MESIILSRIKVFDKEITLKEIELLSPYLKVVILNKGEYFLKQNQKNSRIGILLSGVLLANYTSEKGKEEVARIYSVENNNVIISNHESYFFNTPSTECIIAVNESKIAFINKEDLIRLENRYPKIEKTIALIAEISYILLQKRVRDLQSLTAEDRVRKYYGFYKPLFNKVNKKDMASYLSINRNDFTKILKKL